jgi:hypothetical protein
VAGKKANGERFSRLRKYEWVENCPHLAVSRDCVP